MYPTMKEQIQKAAEAMELAKTGRGKGYWNWIKFQWGSFTWWFAWKTQNWPVIGDLSCDYIMRNSTYGDDDDPYGYPPIDEEKEEKKRKEREEEDKKDREFAEWCDKNPDVFKNIEE